MKIPLFYIPKTKYKYFLEVKRRYTYSKYIIPIGRDCHVAYCLRRLGLRKESLPFDWAGMKAQYGIKSVNEIFLSRFENYMEFLVRNEEGNTISKNFPFVHFRHSKAVIDDKELQDKFKIRIKKLLHLIDNKDVAYLHILEVHTFTNADVLPFVESVKNFTSILKKNDSLHIYIRYDEAFINENIANEIISRCKNLSNVYLTTYDRNKEKYGIWGNSKYYPILLKNVGIHLKKHFPSFKIIS